MGHCHHCSFPREWHTWNGHEEGEQLEHLGLARGDATAGFRGDNGAVRADPAPFSPVDVAGSAGAAH